LIIAKLSKLNLHIMLCLRIIHYYYNINIPVTRRVKGYTIFVRKYVTGRRMRLRTRFVGKYVTGTRKRFQLIIYIFLIRITSRVDLAMSVRPPVRPDER